jgi:hypothetical protein
VRDSDVIGLQVKQSLTEVIHEEVAGQVHVAATWEDRSTISIC